jgi:hypothetical protein
MAREIKSVDRQVVTPNVPVTSNNAFATVGQATAELGKLVADKLEDQAVYYSGLAGEADALAGTAPKTLIPFGRAGQAYAKAVATVEARQLSNQGREMILQSYTEMANPATFNPETPAMFNARVTGITQGIVDNTRPENRAAVQAQLEEYATTAKIKMLDSAIDYDNAQTLASFTRDKESLEKQLTEAQLTKNKEQENLIWNQLQETIKDYGIINEQIKIKAPEYLRKLDETRIINEQVADYLAASDQGQGNEFLADFAIRDQPGLTTAQKFDAMGKMIEINNQTEHALNLTRAVDKQKLINDIDNPLSESYVFTEDQVTSRPDFQQLSPLQQQQVLSHFYSVRNGKAKSEAKYAHAYKEISLGRGGSVPKGTIDELFEMTRDNIESQQNRPLTLPEQFEIVKGLTTNVPLFDHLIASKLTSYDPVSTLEAGKLYATVTLEDQTNLVNLGGDAAIMAQKMMTYLNGTAVTDDKAVQNIINTVLKKDDANIAERNAEVQRLWAKNGAGYYKDIFGVKPDAFSDNGAYKVFEQAFVVAYANSATASEAARIAKDSMREWGTDPFFQPDTINQFPPVKELPLSNGTFAITNQIAIGFNAIANRYNATINTNDKNERRSHIKFANNITLPEQISQTDLVEKPLVATESGITDPMQAALPYYDTTTQIPVVVDGVESLLKLQPSPQTKASPNRGLVYGLMAKDKFGVYQQLRDPASPDGLAYIVLNDLDRLVPDLYKEEGNQQLLDAYKRSQVKQNEAQIEGELLQSILGDDEPLFPQPAEWLAKIGSKVLARFKKGNIKTVDELRRMIAEENAKAEAADGND